MPSPTRRTCPRRRLPRARRRSSGRSPSRNCLLVVDNCEHVQDAARTWLERLLSDCRSLHVLATSRLRLMLPFEHVVSVPGLSLDAAGADDAVALFIERMVAAGADRPSGAADRETIAEICAALEGMALGIELAAARVPGLGLEALAGALGSRLDILDIGARADDRHRSLRAAIDWSYELLAPDERAVLRAAATFAAPADLDAICAVTRQPSPTVLDALAHLVDWNLASLKAGSPMRYRVLETIRQYAIDAAESVGEAVALRDAHLEWCRSRLDDLRARAPGDERWCSQVDDVLDDARAALAWADQARASPVAAITMAGLLADVLFQRGHPGEAQRRYQEAALLAGQPGERCRWLRLAAGAAAARNVGGDTIDLLIQTADVALASGAADDAAYDLAAAAALQYRAPGIIRRPIDIPSVDAQLTRARAISQGGARAQAAIAVAAGWAPGANVRSPDLTEQAMRLAGRTNDPLLISEAFDQLSGARAQRWPPRRRGGGDRPATRRDRQRPDRTPQRVRALRHPADGLPCQARHRQARRSAALRRRHRRTAVLPRATPHRPWPPHRSRRHGRRLRCRRCQR